MSHDSLVLAALDALDVDDVLRHLADLNRLYLRMLDSPDRYGPVDFELKREALVRRCNDDPTCRVWAAWAWSRALAVEAEAIWEGQE